RRRPREQSEMDLRRLGRRHRPLTRDRGTALVPTRAPRAGARAGKGCGASHACGRRNGHRDDESGGRADCGSGPPDDGIGRGFGRRAAYPDATRPADDLPGLWTTISARIALLRERRRDADAAQLTVFSTPPWTRRAGFALGCPGMPT